MDVSDRRRPAQDPMVTETGEDFLGAKRRVIGTVGQFLDGGRPTSRNTTS